MNNINTLNKKIPPSTALCTKALCGFSEKSLESKFNFNICSSERYRGSQSP